ncbi:hypothetical protein ABPG72_015445 [Tetrahymena utriculariae]
MIKMQLQQLFISADRISNILSRPIQTVKITENVNWELRQKELDGGTESYNFYLEFRNWCESFFRDNQNEITRNKKQWIEMINEDHPYTREIEKRWNKGIEEFRSFELYFLFLTFVIFFISEIEYDDTENQVREKIKLITKFLLIGEQYFKGLKLL